MAAERHALLLLFTSSSALICLDLLLKHNLGQGVVVPDVLTLVVLYFSLFHFERARYLPLLAVGFMRDLVTLTTPGTFAILYALVFKLLYPVRRSIFRESPITQLVLAFITVTGLHLGYHAALVLQNAGVGWSLALQRSLLLAVWTAPAAIGVCYAFHALAGRHFSVNERAMKLSS